MKLFKASILVNIFFVFIIFYLAYHLIYGNFNIQNYLVYKFEEKIWKQKQETLDKNIADVAMDLNCLLYTSPSPRDQRGSRMPSSA